MRIFFIILLFCNTNSFAEDLGIGVAGIMIPHYMGSQEEYSVVLPFPIAFSEKEIFTDNKNISLDLNLDMNLPVTSMDSNATRPSHFGDDEEAIIKDKNYARRGMDDLPFALYTGISFTIKNQFIGLELSTSPGFFVGNGWKHAGLKTKARINIYTFVDNSPKSASCLCFYVENIYTNSDYNKTYYGVSSNDVLSERKEYNANKSGFLGTKAGIYYVKRFHSIVLMGWLNLNLMEKSVVRDSPLVIRKNSGSSALALGYMF